MGFIGVGGKGGRNLQDFVKGFKNVACVAACDVKKRAARSAQRIAKLPDSALYTGSARDAGKGQSRRGDDLNAGPHGISRRHGPACARDWRFTSRNR